MCSWCDGGAFKGCIAPNMTVIASRQHPTATWSPDGFHFADRRPGMPPLRLLRDSGLRHPHACNRPSCLPCTQLLVARFVVVSQANIDTFIPRAIATAAALRARNISWSYMTQPFIAAFLLDCNNSGLLDWRAPAAPLLRCPNASEVASFRDAVKRGDIWYGAPA